MFGGGGGGSRPEVQLFKGFGRHSLLHTNTSNNFIQMYNTFYIGCSKKNEKVNVFRVYI